VHCTSEDLEIPGPVLAHRPGMTESRFPGGAQQSPTQVGHGPSGSGPFHGL